MGVEIEKKYRLTPEQRERVVARLDQISGKPEREEFEENTLFTGGLLNIARSILRLRRIGETALLTYKERFPSSSPIKHQREDETRVEDAGAMTSILDGLGFEPALVYEKRRATWRLENAEVVLDELPFGLFMEIEGDEEAIGRIERLLGLEDIQAESESYPQLAERHGKARDGRIEARFDRA
jgi:adenylate cyclase, class 2